MHKRSDILNSKRFILALTMLIVLAAGIFGGPEPAKAAVGPGTGCFWPAGLTLSTNKQTVYLNEPFNLKAVLKAPITDCGTGNLPDIDVRARFYTDENFDELLKEEIFTTLDGEEEFTANGIILGNPPLNYKLTDSPAKVYVILEYLDTVIPGGWKAIGESERLEIDIVAGSIETDPPHSDGGSTTKNTGASIPEPWDILGGPIVTLINGILVIILAVLRSILTLIASYIVLPILELTLSIDAANVSSVIVVGWTWVRDIVNMIFILILIILGFATILKLESYNYRRVLVDLILMAILVNFSLVIARIIIQVADLALFTFLPDTDAVRYLFEQLTAVHTWELMSFTNILDLSGSLADSVSLIFQFILELGVIITFAALAAYTLIRLVALWILMVLSPFAYALRVLPATQGIAKQWWSTFIKYVFVTPVIAFFLRLTIEIYHQGLILTDNVSFGSGSEKFANIGAYFEHLKSLDKPPFTALLELLVIYVIILAFMWGGILVAGKLGVFGASAITGLASRGIRAPFGYARRGVSSGAGYAAQRIHKTTGVELRPSEWKSAWQTYRKKRISEDKVKGGLRAEARLHQPGGLLKKEIMSKLGSPEDFYRQFLDPKEYKRMFGGGQSAAMKAYKGAGKLKDENINSHISESEKKKLEQEQTQKRFMSHELRSGLAIGSLRIDTGTTAEKVKSAINGLIKSKQEEMKRLKDLGDEDGANAIKDEVKTLKDELSGVEIKFDPTTKLGSEVEKTIKSLQQSLDKDVAALGKSISKPPVSDEQMKEWQTQYQNLVREGNSLRAPQSYEHDLERLHLEAEEMSKLKGIQNSDQLVALLHEAIRSKNQFRSAAIWKKLAGDYNDNEFLNHTVDPNAVARGKRAGDSYGSGRQGMLDYMNDVMIKELNMDKQAALKMVDEIAYINESRNHWANARLVKYEGGELHEMSEDEHVGAAVAEISKKNPRQALGDINRLGYGEEVQHASGEREFKIDKLGIAMAKILGQTWADSGQMQYINNSAAKNLKKSIDELRKRGVSEKYIMEIQKRGGDEPNYGKIIERI